jgi:hypothetical protein
MVGKVPSELMQPNLIIDFFPPAKILIKSTVQIIADAKGLMKGRKDDGPE